MKRPGPKPVRDEEVVFLRGGLQKSQRRMLLLEALKNKSRTPGQRSNAKLVESAEQLGSKFKVLERSIIDRTYFVQ